MGELLPRITGTEMEWSVSRAQPAQLATEITPAIDYRERAVRIGDFLVNGARFYMDIGDHPEYATPTDTSFLGTTANEIAGEEIMKHAYMDISEEQGRFSVHKRLIDDTGTTWGNHENYALDATKSIEYKPAGLALLGLHLATRNILFGGGTLRPQGTFCLAQKALDIWDDYSLDTANSKPVVNTRQEHWADKTRWNRIHVTSGDANISPWSIRMKLGTTSLVLRLMEAGVDSLDRVRFEQPLATIMQSVAKDIQLKNRYPLKDYGSMSALDIQKLLLTEAKLLAKEGLPAEEEWTIDQWDQALYELKKNPELLADRVDWIAKLNILRKRHEKHGYSWTDKRMRSVDAAWGLMDNNIGIGLKYRQTVFAKWMPPESLIHHRMKNAPSSTSSTLRSRFIKEFHTYADAELNWDYVCINNTRVLLDDPYATTSPKLDALIQKYRTTKASKERAA